MKHICLVFMLLITACSSVPLSTIMHFSSSKPDDFFQVDPRGITVKVTINSEANFDAVMSVNLSALIKDEAGQRKFSFPLEQISKQQLPAKNGFFSSQPAVDVFTLKLSAQAIKSLQAIQVERKSANNKSIGLSAGVNFSQGMNVINEDTVLSIELKLTGKDDFIMLIDKWRVKSAY